MTPSGVPVKITSPACSVRCRDKNAICWRTLKIMRLVFEDCRTSPFTLHSMSRFCASTRSAPTSHGPDRSPAVAGLAHHPLTGRHLDVAGTEVLTHRIAEDMVEGIGLADVASAAADHDDHLGLVVERPGRLGREADDAVVRVHRRGELVEEDRRGRDL